MQDFNTNLDKIIILRIKTNIIGLGKIGKDYDNSHKYNIGNYVTSVLQDHRLQLISLLDISTLKFDKKIKKIKNIKLFTSIHKMMANTNPDLVIVSSSTSSQYMIMKKILKYEPKYIILEKPACQNEKELKNIINQKKKSKIYVNYVKRYNKIYNYIYKLIKNKKYGQVESIKINFAGGSLNIGSHALDLICYLMNLKELNIRKKTKINNNIHDLITFILNKKYHIEIKKYKKKKLYLFELEIGFEKGRITLLNNELQLKEFIIKKTFKENFRSSAHFNEFIQTKIINYKIPKVSSTSQFLNHILNKNKKKVRVANLNNALMVHKFYKKVF